MDNQEKEEKSINYWTDRCFKESKERGWWPDEVYNSPMAIPTKIALIHSELSEALEGHRRGLRDDHLTHRLMFEVELADACIRIFDLAGACGCDLEGAIEEKMTYNRHRQDHNVEVRNQAGGKTY